MFFDENNAIEVQQYFRLHHPDFKKNIYELFTFINHKTKSDIF